MVLDFASLDDLFLSLYPDLLEMARKSGGEQGAYLGFDSWVDGELKSDGEQQTPDPEKVKAFRANYKPRIDYQQFL